MQVSLNSPETNGNSTINITENGIQTYAGSGSSHLSVEDNGHIAHQSKAWNIYQTYRHNPLGPTVACSGVYRAIAVQREYDPEQGARLKSDTPHVSFGDIDRDGNYIPILTLLHPDHPVRRQINADTETAQDKYNNFGAFMKGLSQTKESTPISVPSVLS